MLGDNFVWAQVSANAVSLAVRIMLVVVVTVILVLVVVFRIVVMMMVGRLVIRLMIAVRDLVNRVARLSADVVLVNLCRLLLR